VYPGFPASPAGLRDSCKRWEKKEFVEKAGAPASLSRKEVLPPHDFFDILKTSA
jgi:hypothetical protein